MEAVEFGTFAHNGIIEIPIEYRESYSTDIRVILMRNQCVSCYAVPGFISAPTWNLGENYANHD